MTDFTLTPEEKAARVELFWLLKELQADSRTTIAIYEKLGPQRKSWLTGYEYYDASLVIECARDRLEKLNKAMSALRRLEGKDGG